jgi:UDP-N-acetylmuramoyl-tripeptide--D-alanyl-D-alanine ligase
MRITASEVARLTGGRLVGDDTTTAAVSFDTRTLRAGEAFAAIVDSRDGNDFVVDAMRVGASFALVSRGRSVDGVTCIEVDDTTVALGLWGNHERRRMASQVRDRVVAVTGSAGKTSTKNLVHAVLSQKHAHVHSAAHSLNNDIGVPVTIINAPDDVDALVVEMGMRGFHEIDRLCRIAEPVVGIITNIGDAHGERVGGPDGIARAKGELIEALPSNGTAILNADDRRCVAIGDRAQCRVLTYGSSAGDLRWTIQSTDNRGRATVRFEHDGRTSIATPTLPGAHMAANAAAAVLAGIACGLDLHTAVQGIGRENAEFGRVVWLEHHDGRRILDDSYNANTSSMLAALEVLASAESGHKIAALGRMSEVADPTSAHASVMNRARELGIEVLALETDAYGTDAMSLDEVVEAIGRTDWRALLVKGSRAAACERVVQRLLNG